MLHFAYLMISSYPLYILHWLIVTPWYISNTGIIDIIPDLKFYLGKNSSLHAYHSMQQLCHLIQISVALANNSI